MPAITSLPAVITQPGSYWLDQSFSLSLQSGSAIEIKSSFVTIDFRGHAIWNSFGLSNLAAMIDTGVAQGLSGNTIIRPKSFGFFRSVRLLGDRCEVSDGNLHAWFRPIETNGIGNAVRRNLISGAGGTLAAGFQHSHVFGIELFGHGCVAEGNLISGLAKVGFAGTIGEVAAIAFSEGCIGGFAKGNFAALQSHMPRTMGIWIGGNSRVSAEENTMINFCYGLCGSSQPDGEFKNNTIVGATVDYYWSNMSFDDGGRNT